LGLTLFALQDAPNAAISGSAHDFSSYGWSGGRICIVCHTPHGADTTVTDAPLWNHAVTTATYTLYAGSSTLNATIGQPNGVAKLCLSCHDGTVAIDSYGGNTGTQLVDALNVNANVGTNLADDHPISFVYDSTLAAADGELVDPAADGDTDPNTVGMGAPYLPLFNNQMQCASCHDVHNTVSAGNPSLLLKSPVGSQLCLTCHQK
jgi:predicted CXXCH cytochrome family protein